MRKITLSFTLLFVITSLFAQNLKLGDVEAIEQQDGFYQSGDLYFGGQPNLETIQWLKEQGVTRIINLRSENENTQFSESAFCEKKIVEEAGIEFVSIPVSGKDAYNPKTLKSFAGAIDPGVKTLIHCRSGGRVRILFMAYLVKYQNYSMNEAMDFGKELGYTNYVELLLDEKVEYK